MQSLQAWKKSLQASVIPWKMYFLKQFSMYYVELQSNFAWDNFHMFAGKNDKEEYNVERDKIVYCGSNPSDGPWCNICGYLTAKCDFDDFQGSKFCVGTLTSLIEIKLPFAHTTPLEHFLLNLCFLCSNHTMLNIKTCC